MEMTAVTSTVGRIEGNFPSADGKSQLRVLTWVPITGDIRGIVQIVHGMVEHIGRYEAFACTLANAGFLVVGEDHIGHGKSVASPDDLGHLPMASGADVMTEDVYRLGAYYRRAYPGVPFFLFGHSMGSFIARRCCEEHGSELTGAILCGTGNIPVPVSLAANALCHSIARVKGERYRSKLVDKMGVGSYAAAIEDAQGELDWLSVNPKNVAAYEADSLCGARFSLGGYASLTLLTAELATRAHASEVPSDLPLFFVSGAMDPVGDFGEGVLRACELYREAGVLDCTMRLYPGLRHEILNEKEHEEVEQDILDWIEAHMPKEAR